MGKKTIIAALAALALVIAVVLTIVLSRMNQNINKKAAIQGGVASLALSPTSTSFSAASAGTVDLTADTAGVAVDGIQVVATVSGTLPTDLEFKPSTPSGLVLAFESFDKASSSATLHLAYLTQNVNAPFTGVATLGQFTFTTPDTGSITISFDNTLTRIVQNQTSLDIVGIPTPQTYTFVAATASPTASPSPSPSPSSSPTGSPSPTPSGNATCTRGNQSISLSPASQSAFQGQTLTYTVNVTNNDDAVCDKANFSLSTILPSSAWVVSFAQSVLSIAPQTSVSTTLNVTSPFNSPLGDLPIGVMAVGPKAAVVATSIYKVLAPTPTPAAPQVVVVPPGFGIGTASPRPSPASTPIAYVAPTPGPAKSIFETLPTWLIAALGGFLLIVLLFIIGSLLGKGKNEEQNPPQINPPVTSWPTTPPTTNVPPMPPVAPPTASINQPTVNLSHSVEPPINQPVQ